MSTAVEKSEESEASETTNIASELSTDNAANDSTGENTAIDNAATNESKFDIQSLQHLSTIDICLRRAGAEKGGFSPADVRAMTEATDCLAEFFKNDAEASKKEFNALVVLEKCWVYQQGTGVYTFEATMELLKATESLTASLNARKSVDVKLDEMKKKLAREPTKPQKPSTHQHNNKQKGALGATTAKNNKK